METHRHHLDGVQLVPTHNKQTNVLLHPQHHPFSKTVFEKLLVCVEAVFFIFMHLPPLVLIGWLIVLRLCIHILMIQAVSPHHFHHHLQQQAYVKMEWWMSDPDAHRPTSDAMALGRLFHSDRRWEPECFWGARQSQRKRHHTRHHEARLHIWEAEIAN